MTGAGSSTGYAMMAATPGNGYAFQWDADGNGFLEGNVNTGSTTYPSWLRLQRDGSTYTGYYSTDGESWTRVGSAEVAAPAAEQDLGMFSTSHSVGTQAASEFEGFDVDVPFVSASADPAQGTAPLRVRFRANPTVQDATYRWDFGDGRPPSTSENPTHTYARAGTYTATVTATRPNGDSSTSSVQVKVLPYCRRRATPDPGYRMLFDNHPASLENWTMAGPGGFELQPDCTIMSYGGLGLLWYEEEFASPHTIKLDWKMAGDDNSGVFVGFPNPGTDPWVAVNEGYEIQIDATDDPDSTTGAIYNFQAPDAATRDRVLNPPGQWNTFEITVDDPRIVVRLNGEVINDFTSTDPARDLSSGYVGLQNHGTGDDVFFRNVQVRAGP
jgi:cytochrome c